MTKQELRKRAERAEAAHSEASMLLEVCRKNREIAERTVARLMFERDVALERLVEIEREHQGA